MSIHSLNSLVYSQSYFNTLNSTKDLLNEILGHRRTSMWLDLVRISHSGKLVIKETYSYLAALWKCSRRTAIRNIKAFEEYGFIIKKTNKIKHNFNAVNDYQICTPENFINIIKNFAKRKQVMPNIDYSVQPNFIEDEQEIVKSVKEEPLKEIREIPRPNDTRNLLDLNVKKSTGNLGAILERIKEKVKGRKIEDIKQPKTHSFNIFGPSYPQGGGDTNVTDQELIFKKDNKSTPKACAMNFVNQNGENNQASEQKQTPIEVPDWIKRKLWEFISGDHYISDKNKLFREAIRFIRTNHGYDCKHSLNVFKKRIRQNKWTTPIAMRYENDNIWDR